MPDSKITKQMVGFGTTRIIQALLFILVMLTGLFIHFTNPIYNWLTVLVLLGITIYFTKSEKSLFGPSLFFLMAYLTTMLPIPFVRLGLFFLIPLAIYAVLIWMFPPLKKHCRWYHKGRIDKFTWLAGLAIAAVSSFALYLWAVFAKPNLSDLLSLIPNQSLGTLLVFGFGFAIANSIVEESIYRGILWQAFGRIFGNVVIVTLLQAVVFGIAHIQGFPRGPIGVAMAFVYGILLGWVRHRSRGLMAPMIVHFIADLTIYIIMLWMMGKF
jgi:uncharacterized protein